MGFFLVFKKNLRSRQRKTKKHSIIQPETSTATCREGERVKDLQTRVTRSWVCLANVTLIRWSSLVEPLISSSVTIINRESSDNVALTHYNQFDINNRSRYYVEHVFSFTLRALQSLQSQPDGFYLNCFTFPSVLFQKCRVWRLSESGKHRSHTVRKCCE